MKTRISGGSDLGSSCSLPAVVVASRGQKQVNFNIMIRSHRQAGCIRKWPKFRHKWSQSSLPISVSSLLQPVRCCVSCQFIYLSRVLRTSSFSITILLLWNKINRITCLNNLNKELAHIFSLVSAGIKFIIIGQSSDAKRDSKDTCFDKSAFWMALSLNPLTKFHEFYV